MDITLALGGGGSKGNTHIGVLRKLEQEGFQIQAIAGTSFGALVAAFYALGFSPNEIEDKFSGFDQNQIFGHSPEQEPSLMGIAGGEKWLNDTIGGKTFADMRIPCVLTAVDLQGGREVLLSEGSVVDAILASCAIPGVLPARRSGDWELVDGGTLNPVPVAPARSLAPKLPVVAVVLNEPLGVAASSWTFQKPAYLPDLVVRRITQTRTAQAFDVFLRSMDIVSRAVAYYRLEVDNPEIVIRPNVSDIDTLENVDIREVARRGEEAVEAILPELKNLFAWHNRLRRAIGVKP